MKSPAKDAVASFSDNAFASFSDLYTLAHTLANDPNVVVDKSVVRWQLNKAVCSRTDTPIAAPVSTLLELAIPLSVDDRAVPEAISTPKVSVEATMNSIIEKPLRDTTNPRTMVRCAKDPKLKRHTF